jgi:hypothetical protein
MRDPGLAAVLRAIIPGVGQFYNGRILAGILLADYHAWIVDRHRRSARMGVPRYLGLHRLQLRPRSPGAYLCELGYSPNVGGGKFSEVRKRGQRDQAPASCSSNA